MFTYFLPFSFGLQRVFLSDFLMPPLTKWPTPQAHLYPVSCPYFRQAALCDISHGWPGCLVKRCGHIAYKRNEMYLHREHIANSNSAPQDSRHEHFCDRARSMPSTDLGYSSEMMNVLYWCTENRLLHAYSQHSWLGLVERSWSTDTSRKQWMKQFFFKQVLIRRSSSCLYGWRNASGFHLRFVEKTWI